MCVREREGRFVVGAWRKVEVEGIMKIMRIFDPPPCLCLQNKV